MPGFWAHIYFVNSVTIQYLIWHLVVDLCEESVCFPEEVSEGLRSCTTDSVTLKIMEREGVEYLFHSLSVAAVVATVTI